MPQADQAERIARLGEIMTAGEPVLLCCHQNPDGDSLGSALAIALAFQNAGHKVACYAADPVPYNLHFLPGIDRVVHEIPERLSLVVLCDCGDVSRISDSFPQQIGDARVVVIDHHASSHVRNEFDLIDTAAAATGVMAHRLIRGLGMEIDKACGTNMYCAITTDTGRFAYSNTSREVFEICAELVDLGVEPAFVSEEVYERMAPGALRLLQRALTTLDIQVDKGYAHMELNREAYETAEASDDMSEGIVNYARSIDGIEVGILFRQIPDGRVKLSFRSRKFVDVAKFAERFGGGGHARASGATLKTTSLAEAKAMVLGPLSEEIAKVLPHG